MRIIAVVLLMFQGVILTAQTNRQLYVSPGGHDSWPGTFKKPFLSIERAQQEVRKIKREDHGPITVFLREGNYALNKTLVFTPDDGGSKEYPVRYTAYQEELPIIHGGKEIKDWKLNKDGLWEAPYEGSFFRQLYVNGERRTRARHPNKGNYFRINAVDYKHNEVLVGRKDIAPLLNEQGLEMIWQIHWAESIIRVHSLSNAGGHMKAHNGNLKPHPDDAAILFNRPNPNHRTGQSYHFENAMVLIDQPGEWFFDSEKKKIYYLPQEDEFPKNTRVVVPSVETLLKVEGSDNERVENLIFEGISFQFSNWKKPGNAPYLNVQAGFHNSYADITNLQKVFRPQSAVLVRWAEDVTFLGNIFKNLGSTALDFNYGTKSCKIVGNIFSDIAGGGILVGKFVEDSLTSINLPYNPSNKEIVSTDDKINNNLITRIGQDYYGTCGIASGYTVGTVIDHNHLYDLPYTGISVGFGWTDELSAIKQVTVAYNHVEKVMNLMADGGGIYTLSKQPGSIIKGNYITNLKKSPWASPWHLAGIYLDYMSGGTLQQPMILEHNFVDMSENKLYKAPYAGIVLHVNNRFGGSGGELGMKIKQEAGLLPEYLHLLKVIADN